MRKVTQLIFRHGRRRKEEEEKDVAKNVAKDAENAAHVKDAENAAHGENAKDVVNVTQDVKSFYELIYKNN